MNTPESGFHLDLRMPVMPVAIALAAAGLWFTFSVGLISSEEALWVAPVLALGFYAGALATWGLSVWKPWLGRWCPVLVSAAAVGCAAMWLGRPELLMLFVIPTGLAIALVGLPAGVLTACVSTALVIIIVGAADSAGWTIAAVGAVAMWTVVGLMAGMTWQVRGTGHWAWDHYQTAADLLVEARGRQAQLQQALADLAQANAQLTRLNKLAQGLQQAADEARRAKEEFVANVSHELRTPLNMIIGFTELITGASKAYGELPPILLADLAVIQRNARHLAELIDDVLDLSQIEAEQMGLLKEAVSVPEIVDAAIEAVRPLYQSKQLYLRADVEAGLPQLFADRTRIREVLLNLLSNAGRFTARGGVTVRAWREQDVLWIAVTDTGPGIAAHNLGKLFQPFQQGDGSIRRLHGGTGLGLSISKRLVELHDGRIFVESQEGVGTTFTLRLPFKPPVRLPPRPGVEYVRGLQPGWEYLERTGPSQAPKVTARPRWVVFERGEVLTRLLSRHMDGVEVVPTASLEDASRELAAQPCQALIVNDTSVGQALERLEAAALPRGALALICAAPGIEGSASLPGIAGYLVKPVLLDALLTALDRLQLRGKTILVVDDEPDMLRLLRRGLTSSVQRYHVLRADNGRQGLEMLREHRPDAVLLDLVMPEVDGFQFLEIKNRDPDLRDIPVIVISAQDPTGQPVVSRALAVTLQTGLSAPRLLACCRALVEILSPV